MARSGHTDNGHRHLREMPDVSYIKNVDVTHEESDVQVQGILKFAVALSVMTIVVFVLMAVMFRYLNEENKEPPPAPMALSEKERLPPEPRLQGAPGFGQALAKDVGFKELDEQAKKPRDPLWEIRALRQRWSEVLEHGPKDESGKVIGMPIKEAMTKVLEGKGLPSTAQPDASADLLDYAVAMPTAASSGRTTERRRQ